jgi:hypothetical protein
VSNCGKETIFGGTAHLLSHLSDVHGIVEDKRTNNALDTSSSSHESHDSNSDASQERQKKSGTSRKHKRINRLLVSMIATAFLPFAFVMNEFFREFCRALNRYYKVPSVFSISNSILDKSIVHILQQIRSDIKGKN